MFLMFLSFVYIYVCITYTAGKHSFLCVVTETFPHTHYLKINSRLHQFMLHKIFWSEKWESKMLYGWRELHKKEKRESKWERTWVITQMTRGWYPHMQQDLTTEYKNSPLLCFCLIITQTNEVIWKSSINCEKKFSIYARIHVHAWICKSSNLEKLTCVLVISYAWMEGEAVVSFEWWSQTVIL